ncbi:galactokinase [Niabella ginsenosidivorans]|uniref:Galactokinase n=1 Tax=Niabella ginsenosidivorans TaxID=1176587 RepID=A0A1A9I2P1_9BACT|nr:galactokinase [Niabella ginsenosidivorans]ANH80980.1 galactokinase [Niabella ginsenosidivorans]
MTIAELQKEFEKIYNKPTEHIFFCPGRVNLIGEHIDYNGGQVMPCAISLGTTLLVAKNNESVFRFHATDFEETATVAINKKGYTKSGSGWFNYPVGVIHEMQQKNITITGLDFLFSGNLPIGSGLSSSASVEVLTAHALNQLFAGGLTNVELAVLGKKVENGFMGLNSGIMDQFAVAMGKAGQAVLLNTDTLDYEYIPFEIGDHVLAIINSNKPRKLVESKYNERFSECRAALEKLRQQFPVNHLVEISIDQFSQHKGLLNDPVLEKRALHVISENNRVKQAKDALINGAIKTFGELMYASHDSLQHLYEVSGPELDAIVDFCRTYQNCIGARMTGAGFGGCAIALIKKDSFDDFSEKITAAYEAKIGYPPGVFSSVIAEGVRTVA